MFWLDITKVWSVTKELPTFTKYAKGPYLGQSRKGPFEHQCAFVTGAHQMQKSHEC